MSAAVRDEKISLELLKNETENDILAVESVSTATLYDGQLPLDFLLSKYNAIVAANPWLEGRLVKNKGKLALEYSKIPVDVGSTGFVHLDNIKHENFSDLNTSVWAYSEDLTPYVVKAGASCIGKNEPLFRIIVGAASSNQFFVVMSICHVIGDGHTFYRLYKMLCSECQPIALEVDRHKQGGNEVATICKEGTDFFRTAGTICNLVGNYCFGKKGVIRVAEVNKESIQRIKDAYKAKAEGDKAFLSTNDIITSEFFTKAKSDIGVMAINFRNRINGLTDNHAGNYESMIPYQKGDFEEPELIRKSLSSNFARLNKNSPLIPGFFAKRKATISMITNWTSFYYQIKLPNAVHVAHFPVFETLKYPYVMGCCIIFKKDDETLAVFTCEHVKRPIVANMGDLVL